MRDLTFLQVLRTVYLGRGVCFLVEGRGVDVFDCKGLYSHLRLLEHLVFAVVALPSFIHRRVITGLQEGQTVLCGVGGVSQLCAHTAPLPWSSRAPVVLS